MYEKFGQFIDGKWQKSSDEGTYEVINPANEEVLGKASKATTQDVERALKSAAKGLEVWKKTAPWQRSYIIRRIADKMRLQARFKTSSRKIRGVKTGEYNFWSVVSLIVDAMSGEKESLDEGLLDIMKKKVKSLALKVINGVKNFIFKKVSNLFKFLGAIPTISVKNRIDFK